MTAFIDKIIIYLFGAMAILFNCHKDIVVVYLLAGILILGVYQIIYDFKNMYVEFALIIVTILLTVRFPLISYFIPVIIYHHIYHYFDDKKKCFSFLLADMAIYIYVLISMDNSIRLFMLMIVSFSIISAAKSHIIYKWENMVRKLRDDSVEITLALTDKNRFLLKNIEEEIHIATLSERNRIARDIHDNVGHLISRSILQLGAIRAVNKDKATGILLEQLKDTLDESMNNIRESVHDLHKESFDLKVGAEKILEELKGYEVIFDCDISISADKEVKYTFLTILKEAITNIIKHSDANRVEVEMRELDNYYQLLIEDNGNVKKDIRNVNAGIGVSNMEERVKKMSGIINISVNKGFRIFISIPKN